MSGNYQIKSLIATPTDVGWPIVDAYFEIDTPDHPDNKSRIGLFIDECPHYPSTM
jgi:hypothetical protein